MRFIDTKIFPEDIHDIIKNTSKFPYNNKSEEFGHVFQVGKEKYKYFTEQNIKIQIIRNDLKIVTKLNGFKMIN